jgi:hypothetical protein
VFYKYGNLDKGRLRSNMPLDDTARVEDACESVSREGVDVEAIA